MKDVILKRQYALTYSSVFDDYDFFNISDTLKEIPTITAIERISYILSQISVPWNTNKPQHSITLGMWVLRMTSEDNQKVSKIIQAKNLLNKPDFFFIDSAACLMLTEYLLENNNLTEQELTREQESKLFKSYLWCTSISIKKQEEAYSYTGKEDIADLISKILPARLNFREIDSFKDYRVQFMKTLYFFKFCETDTQYKEYLSLFIKEYNLGSWDKYLLHLITFYLKILSNPEITPKLNVLNQDTLTTGFLDMLCIKEFNKYKRTDDFMSLRNYPVYKHGNNYLFLYFNFFADKFFQGFLFDFAKILKKNGCKISDYGKLKSDLGLKYSEHITFYKTMDLSFSNYTNVRLRGESIKKILKDAEPDFFMRQGNKVFLFEFKDSTLNEGTKHSGEFEKIRSSILEKFEETSTGQKKGIRQIINSIKYIRSSQFNRPELDLYDHELSTIYPILVHTDCSFEVEGVNYILNERFETLLSEENIKNRHLIKNIILVNLDTLISLQDFFRCNKLKLSSCINEYHDYTNSKRSLLNQIYPFDKYLMRQAYKNGYKNLAPNEFLSMIEELVKSDKNSIQ